MKSLVIAPLPPPINGQSLAASIVHKALSSFGEVEVVNMAKSRPRNALDKIKRYLDVVGFLAQTVMKQRGSNLIYLTISESVAGTVKDFFIYLICFHKRKNIVIHMLGGAGMRTIFERRGVLFHINKYFISGLQGVIVEGESQARLFSTVISRERIYVVPNFAEDFLFVSANDIYRKFEDTSKIQILFLSNLLTGKGHVELVDAYANLSDEIRNRVNVVFVGGFESDHHKVAFLKKIECYKNISYYGKFVTGVEKRDLYGASHIFCLPTYYPYEGQPISILEAYATGCVVIATDHSGIPDIFSDQVNGYMVKIKSPNSIRCAIEKCVDSEKTLHIIALENRNVAIQKYRTAIYSASIIKAFDFHKNA
jgi:glycosyltransferase involved in cell wall biosynthesis